MFLFLVNAGFEDADIRQVAVFLVIIQSITYYKLIRNGKACVIYFYLLLYTALRLVKKGTKMDILRSSLL